MCRGQPDPAFRPAVNVDLGGDTLGDDHIQGDVSLDGIAEVPRKTTIRGRTETAPIRAGVWLVIVWAPPLVFVIEELRKYAVRRGIRWLEA